MKITDYKQNKAREIIEDAMSQLMTLGMNNDNAAGLLVIQGIIRVESMEKRKSFSETVASFAEDAEDDE
ncbi:hypothetical protein H7Q97_02730 [Ochrobactrum sp. CM-21-5]|nr:hypothetical protein [Ochrobactrum sp. CM-21-5]MBC2884315.1 hypothetical protein [Ochrobactrum sp. CM-21-5]